METGELKQQATPWVSRFVLLGCVLITIMLVYSAYRAQELANKLTDSELPETPRTFSPEESQVVPEENETTDPFFAPEDLEAI